MVNPIINGFIEGTNRYTFLDESIINYISLGIYSDTAPANGTYRARLEVWKEGDDSQKNIWDFTYTRISGITYRLYNKTSGVNIANEVSGITNLTNILVENNIVINGYTGHYMHRYYIDKLDTTIVGVLNDNGDYGKNFSTLTPDASGTPIDDPTIIAVIDSDVLATKNAITAYVTNTNNNPTEAQLQAQIVQTGTNVITVSYVNWVATINGSNPVVTYTKTDTVNVTPVDDPAIVSAINSDIASTKTAIQNILVWNTTQAEINAVIVQTGSNVITATISGSNVIINGSNPAVVYTAADSIAIPVNPEIAIIAAINSDAASSKTAINNILTWDITQLQVDNVLVITNGNTVTAVVNAHDIIITFSNVGTTYIKTETISIPDNPEIVTSINADVLALKQVIIALNDMYLTQEQINTLIVATGSNIITAVLIGREVTISGSNPTVLYTRSESVLIPDIIVEPAPEADLYRWVIYNTNTGAIIKDLPTSADDIYLDINNGDEAKISVPAYALLPEERLNWTQFFKPWARGIALIDTVKNWNDTGKVIFAGPIDKRSFSGRSEMIEITAYSIFESLKKTEAKPVWATITNPLDGRTFEAGSWAGVYSAILQSGLSLTGAPATWKPISTYTDLPIVEGVGKSVSTLTVDHERVSDLWEKIRDEKSENGNEFKLTPSLTDLGETQLVWTLEVGSDTNPHINFTDKIVELDFNSTENWEVVEWELDDDATLIYNKLVINGHNTDSVEISQATINADSEMPGLMESFSPGVDLTTEELTAQFTARMKGSLVTEKTLSMVIAGDTSLEWFALIGRKIIAKPGEKTAGAGAIARAVGIRFSTKTLETDLQVDLLKVASRYPKLPKQKENEQIGGGDNYTDGLNGADGASADQAGPDGTLPDGTLPGGTINTPELPADIGGIGASDNDKLMSVETNMDNYSAPGQYGANITEPDKNGFIYSIDNNSTNNLLYNNGTDQVSAINIFRQQVSIVEDIFIEPVLKTVKANEIVYTIAPESINLGNYSLPADTSIWAGEGVNGSLQTMQATTGSKYISIDLYQTGTVLYVWITKERGYGSYITRPDVKRYIQIPLVFDINQTTGVLENQRIGSVFGENVIPLVGEKIVIRPTFETTSGSSTVKVINAIKISETETHFLTPQIYANTYVASKNSRYYADFEALNNIYFTHGVKAEILMGNIPSIKMDSAAAAYPIYEESYIPQLMPKGDGPKNISSKYIGAGAWEETTYDLYERKIGYSVRAGTSDTETSVALYWYDKVSGIIYATNNSVNRTVGFYTNKQEVLDKYDGQMFKINAKSKFANWKTVGKKWKATLNTNILGTTTPVPIVLQKELWTSIIGITELNKTSNHVLKLKGSEWILARSGNRTVANATGSIMGEKVHAYVSSNGKDIKVTQDPQYMGFHAAFTTVPNPYKYKAKHANANCITATDGSIWTWNVNGIGAGYTPSYLTQVLPMKALITTVFKGTTGNTESRLALDNDGFLWAWGKGANFVLGTGNTNDQPTPVKIGSTKWKRVIFNGNSVAGLDTEGYLWTWGSNILGKTAQGTTTGNTEVPTKVGTKKWIEFDFASCLIAIDDSRDLYYSGEMTGQTSTIELTKFGTQKWKTVNAGNTHYAGIATNDNAYTWGSNSSGKTGLGTTEGVTLVPTQVEATYNTLGKYKKLVLTAENSYFLSTDNKIWVTGIKTYTGIDDEIAYTAPKQVLTSAVDNKWNNIYWAGLSFIAIHEDGSAWTPFAPGCGSYAWVPETKGMVVIFGEEVAVVNDEGTKTTDGVTGGSGNIGSAVIKAVTSNIGFGGLYF